MYAIPIKRNWGKIVGETEQVSADSFKNKYIKNILLKIGEADVNTLIKYNEEPYLAFAQPDDGFAHESFAHFRDVMLETFKRGK